MRPLDSGAVRADDVAAARPGPGGAADPGADRGLADDVALLREHGRQIKADLYRQPSGLLRFPFLSAGKNYPGLTDWDAVWGGAAYLLDGDPEPLRNSLLNLLDHIQPDGKGQRTIRPTHYAFPHFQIRPFLATGCFLLSRETDDVDWLGRTGLDKVSQYLRYRHIHRTGRDGLVKWFHQGEGFADNGLANWAWENNVVEGTDLNAQLVLEHRATAWLADRLGDAGTASWHREAAAALHQRLEQVLWHEDDGFYYSRYDSTVAPNVPGPTSPIPCLHYTNLWPLWLGLASEDRARRVIETYVLSEEHFWGPHGLRSMAKSDGRFNNARQGVPAPPDLSNMFGPAATRPCSNWQGPIWAPTTYLTALGLSRYGYGDAARDLAARTVSHLAASLREHGCLFENYHSETGEPLNAGHFGSWYLLVPHLPDDVESPVSWWLRSLDD